MPVRNMTKRTPAPEAAALERIIVQEWRANTDNPDQPIILIDETGPVQTKHVFVVWDRWRGMEQLDRSETIMKACEEMMSPEELQRVTVAMGLTKEEARRMGISYE